MNFIKEKVALPECPAAKDKVRRAVRIEGRGRNNKILMKREL